MYTGPAKGHAAADMRQARLIRVGDFRLGDEETASILEVLASGRLSEGPKVAQFEKEWARYVGTKHAVATSSGSGALVVILAALKHLKGLPAGSKVITSPLTYVATSSAISTVGFTPVFVDVGRESMVITPENIRALLEAAEDPGAFAAILPVHLMGYPVEMDAINDMAGEYGLAVIEDSAQAHGSRYRGRKTGSLSLAAAFSFYIAHNIQAGEMGALTTDDPEIDRLARKLKAQGRACDCLVCTRDHGYCPQLADYEGEEDFDPRFSHDLVGYNFKLMEFQAALGLVQLAKAEWIIRQRQSNVRYLNEHLSCYSDILRLPAYSDDVSYLAYPVVIERPDLVSRKDLRRELEARGVETRPLFGSIPTQQPAYAHLKPQYAGRLPNADYLGLNAFYVGCHQYLTQEDLDIMVEAFHASLGVLRK
jgi:dTDP-4-amino-4,6-dideoxygalactose transaminase